MNNIKCKTFTAKAVVGLKHGYTERSISIDVFKSTLLTEQNDIYKKYNIGYDSKIKNEYN